MWETFLIDTPAEEVRGAPGPKAGPGAVEGVVTAVEVILSSY
jgi:hypothetical protein